MQMKLQAEIISSDFKNSTRSMIGIQTAYGPYDMGHAYDMVCSIPYAKSVIFQQKFEILCKKDKKEAFKCPWVDCNFLRHEWSNHTAKVYHHVKRM